MKDHHAIIKATRSFVAENVKDEVTGHDMAHLERVWKIAKNIAYEEKADIFVVELGALLHDIADHKFYGGDHTVGPKMAAAFLVAEGVDDGIIAHVCDIIENMSFSKSIDGVTLSLEGKIVADADRLDALGAIGIARAFAYGGFKKRKLYDPSLPPIKKLTMKTYARQESHTINHFYEKLLILKDRMYTKTAKKIAEKRHKFVQEYLDEFLSEWNGTR